MSYPMTQLGSRAFSHGPSADTEREYDRLRVLARQEISKKQSLGHQAHEAYERNDKARAHQLSEEAKAHGAQADQYNQQASDYIFRANNANVPGDTIDLHGQYVEEAERILRLRITTAQQQGQGHLHVIVGKGNHSVDHVQKIKPAVENLCQELGIRYRTEENEGRMYLELKPEGGYGYSNQPPPPLPGQFGQQYDQGYGYGGYPTQQQSYGGQQQQQQQQQPQQADETEQLVKGIFNCLRGCCVVM